jgi:hypothetical protein
MVGLFTFKSTQINLITRTQKVNNFIFSQKCRPVINFAFHLASSGTSRVSRSPRITQIFVFVRTMVVSTLPVQPIVNFLVVFSFCITANIYSASVMASFCILLSRIHILSLGMLGLTCLQDDTSRPASLY